MRSVFGVVMNKVIARNDAFVLADTELRERFAREGRKTRALYYQGLLDFEALIDRIQQCIDVMSKRGRWPFRKGADHRLPNKKSDDRQFSRTMKLVDDVANPNRKSPRIPRQQRMSVLDGKGYGKRLISITKKIL